MISLHIESMNWTGYEQFSFLSNKYLRMGELQNGEITYMQFPIFKLKNHAIQINKYYEINKKRVNIIFKK